MLFWGSPSFLELCQLQHLCSLNTKWSKTFLKQNVYYTPADDNSTLSLQCLLHRVIRGSLTTGAEDIAGDGIAVLVVDVVVEEKRIFPPFFRHKLLLARENISFQNRVLSNSSAPNFHQTRFQQHQISGLPDPLMQNFRNFRVLK